MHRLLERQIRRHLGSLDAFPATLQPFIAAVDEAYAKADSDREQVARSLDIMSNELNERNEALLAEKCDQTTLIRKLEEAHNQLLQSEKMASIGQLAAGVAHEINNPIGYVNSNLATLRSYADDLLELVAAYEAAEAALPPAERERMKTLKQRIDVGYLKDDMVAVLDESREGIDRVKKIVQDLKDFSHSGDGRFLWSDIHQGLDSTLNIVANEIKYKADVVKEYGELPQIECMLSQLNQVFMNLLVNAAHAMDGSRRGRITLRTGCIGGETVWVEIADDGCGIPHENLTRIFDPFFSTKPVGKGTGLGLSLSYGIVQKHHGRIEVDSTLGEGTCFRVTLPVRQPEAA